MAKLLEKVLDFVGWETDEDYEDDIYEDEIVESTLTEQNGILPRKGALESSKHE